MTKSRGLRPTMARWSEDEIAVLRARYPHEKTDVIAADFGRSVPSTYGKATLLGLKKSDEFMASPSSGRTNGEIGKESRFAPGVVPWCKGRKVPSTGRSAETQFKKGRGAPNHLPVGSVSVRTDPAGLDRAWVKTVEPNIWRPRAICAWEAENGPVPRGKVIHHRDRDSMNDSPGNLQALTRQEHVDEHRGELEAARAAAGQNITHEREIARVA